MTSLRGGSDQRRGKGGFRVTSAARRLGLNMDFDGVPERVHAEIRKRETVSERLIGWIQLGVVLFFTGLYTLAPRAEGGEGFNFVPFALAAYIVFTVARLLLSYRRELPSWYLILSIFVDMALLCGLIFSFHIQYDQPATFYLKTPTLMYVFIFISLRALRFDPRFVLISGLVGAAGWIFLVLYAVTSQMNHMYVTRNYVEYLTSNAILLGAELDKTIVILGVTMILSIALYRGRTMLFAAVRDQAAAADLRRFFAPEVARSIVDSEEAPNSGEGRVVDAAIMFVDIRGFTHVAENSSPEVVLSVLAHYQRVVSSCIEENGGRIDKYLGDGVLATFGAVASSPCYAADGLRAAREIVRQLEAEKFVFQDLGWPAPLSFGVAVASGSVTTGVVGTRERLEFTVIGNAVNRAAKLEAENKMQSTRALTDLATFEMAVSQGYDGEMIERRDGVRVSGVAGPVNLVVLG